MIYEGVAGLAEGSGRHGRAASVYRVVPQERSHAGRRTGNKNEALLFVDNLLVLIIVIVIVIVI